MGRKIPEQNLHLYPLCPYCTMSELSKIKPMKRLHWYHGVVLSVGKNKSCDRVLSLPSTNDMWDNEGMPDKNDGLEPTGDLIDIDPSHDLQGLMETAL